MRTNIYIDGFNFYYSCIKNTPFKWLDFKKLCNYLLPHEARINKIKYFTAKVSGLNDLDKPIRQQIFLNAIKYYIPEIEIIYGQFKVYNVIMPLVNYSEQQKFVKVVKTEEKGTDVNIAVHMLNDAWEDKYDLAVLISNDSDLSESLRLVRRLKKKVGLFLPFNVFTSKNLLKNTDFIKRIRKGVLSVSQLPNPIPGTNYHKPSSW
jgi:uncharacterized LabA/DUF88 family protein